MPLHKAARVALLVALATAAPLRTAAAQCSTLPRDSTARDSVPADSVRPRCFTDAWGLIPVAGAILGAFVFAPAPLALLAHDTATSTLGFAHDHLDASISGGGIWSDSQTYARAADVQLVRGGAFAEAEAERIDGARRTTYVAARGGWLFHRRSNSVGGVTLGIQRVREDRRQSGPELGLPLVMGNRRAELRLDPTYVFAPGRVLWSFRSALQIRLGDGPWYAGARLAFRSAYRITKDEQDFHSGSVAALLGVRL